MTIPAKIESTGDIMEQVLLKGDLAKLTAEERVRYYNETCKSLGLNPLTKPFEFISLNGKLQLYALRACTDQLRKIHGVSINIVSRDLTAEGILTIHVRASLPDGRVDEDLGAVTVIYPERHPKAGKFLKGDDYANQELKCITKAKRRATLSICGLGWLDETEVEDIPAAKRNSGSELLKSQLVASVEDLAKSTIANAGNFPGAEILNKRENPNINKPEDFVDKAEYDGDLDHPVNNIPRGNPELKKLSKKDADVLLNNLQVKMKYSTNREALRLWGESVRDDVETLPPFHKVKIREDYMDRWNELPS